MTLIPLLMTDIQALIGLLATLALVPTVIACALVATRRDTRPATAKCPAKALERGGATQQKG